MSDIQTISQGNYILHNIDAKKLYVQEPLFTANSGDAVYVGWRPDETVLWEGSAGTGTNLILSENYNNFDRLRFEYRPWSEDETPSHQISEVGTTYNNFTLGSFWNNNTTYATFIYTYQGNGTNQLNFIRGAYNNGNNWTTAGNLSMFKVIGINRKENA